MATGEKSIATPSSPCVG
jgi:hypothetical protein